MIRTRLELPNVLNFWGLTGVGVEVGVYQGEFHEWLLTHWPGTLHGVDPWVHQDDWNDILNNTDDAMLAVQQVAYARLDPWISAGRCHLHQTTSLEASSMDWAHDLDFVYLDARHDEPSVTADLAAWFPHVRPGGLICGHDYLDGWKGGMPFGVKRAVDVFFDQLKLPIVTTTEDSYPSWFVRVPEATGDSTPA